MIFLVYGPGLNFLIVLQGLVLACLQSIITRQLLLGLFSLLLLVMLTLDTKTNSCIISRRNSALQLLNWIVRPLFLVPPSKFSEKVLRVPGKLCVSGVILRIELPSSDFRPIIQQTTPSGHFSDSYSDYRHNYPHQQWNTQSQPPNNVAEDILGYYADNMSSYPLSGSDCLFYASCLV